MISIYERHEIPKGYRETIEINKINLQNVKYVVTAECNNYGWKVVEKLGRFVGLSTISEGYIYVVFK